MNILMPILVLGGLGFVFGVGLAVAAQKLAVKVDPRLEKICGLLPGVNCGACGGAGCFGFAEGLLSGKFELSACRIAKDAAKEQIAGFLGKKYEKPVRKALPSDPVKKPA